MAQRVLQDICTRNQGEARAASARDAVATGEILAAVGVEPEGGGESDDGEAALPAWMEQSDGRFSPPLEAEAAVRGTVVDEEDDREALLVQRKQVRARGVLDSGARMGGVVGPQDKLRPRRGYNLGIRMCLCSPLWRCAGSVAEFCVAWLRAARQGR